MPCFYCFMERVTRNRTRAASLEKRNACHYTKLSLRNYTMPAHLVVILSSNSFHLHFSKRTRFKFALFPEFLVHFVRSILPTLVRIVMVFPPMAPAHFTIASAEFYLPRLQKHIHKLDYAYGSATEVLERPILQLQLRASWHG